MKFKVKNTDQEMIATFPYILFMIWKGIFL